MDSIIRDLLIKQKSRGNDFHGYLAAERDRYLSELMQLPEEDDSFCAALDRRSELDDWLSMFIAELDRNDRLQLFSAIRKWTEESGLRRLLDVIERLERCMKSLCLADPDAV